MVPMLCVQWLELLFSSWYGGDGTTHKGKCMSLFLGWKGEGRIFSVSSDSQLPSDQNNPHGKGAYFGVAYSDLIISNFSLLTSGRKMVYSGSFSPHLKDLGLFLTTGILNSPFLVNQSSLLDHWKRSSFTETVIAKCDVPLKKISSHFS